MDTLIKLLIESRPIVSWFALGEAIRLAGKIAPTVEQFKKKPKDRGAQKQVVELVEEIALFLGTQGTKEARETSYGLSSELTRLRVERIIKL